MKARGQTLIKVSSIFFIIGAVFSLLLSLVILGAGGLLMAGGVAGNSAASMLVGGALGGILIGYAVFSILYAVCQLVVAVIGLKNASKTEAAGKCFKAGIVMIVLASIGFIWGLISQGTDTKQILTSLLGFLFPVLYTVGANMNRQSGRQDIN